MRLLALEIDNFLSFGDGNKLDHLERRGLTLLEGENRDDPSAVSNGAGKSALVDALLWCLFGTTLRGYENDEVVNRHVGSDCRVSVMLEDGKGAWRITRYRKHERGRNRLTLDRIRAGSETDVSKATIAETQEQIHQLLGMTLTTFLNSVVFGQSPAYRFSSLTDKEQKTILDEALGIEQYARALAIAREDAAELRAKFSRGEDALERIRAQQEELEREAGELRAKQLLFRRERKAEVRALVKRIRGVKDQIALQEVIEGDGPEPSELEESRAAFHRQQEAHDREMAGLAERESLVRVQKRSIDRLEAELERHKALEGRCPTCRREVDERTRDSVVVETAERIGIERRELRRLERLVDESKDEVKAACRVFEEHIEKERTLTKLADAARDARTRLTMLRSQRSDLRAQLTATRERKNPYGELKERVDAKFKKLCDEYQATSDEVVELEDRLKLLDFWIEAFGTKGLRSLLIETALPLLNEHAARYSHIVTDGTMTIEFRTRSELKSGKTVERFEVAVINRHGAADYHGNSQGERAKIDLCVGLALQALVASRAKTRFNVAFFDEPFAHVDHAAHERIINALVDTMGRDTVFVVTHDSDLKAHFPGSITVIKEGGISRVEP